MRGRTEKEVPMNMIKQPSSAILTKVSQARVSSRGGHPNRQFESITYEMGLHVPYCIYSQIQTKSDVRGTENRYPRDHQKTVRV